MASKKEIKKSKKIFKLKKFILFFKRTCDKINSKFESNLKQENIDEVYKANLKLKYFNILRSFFDKLIKDKALKARKKIILKIFLKKIKKNFVKFFFFKI